MKMLEDLDRLLSCSSVVESLVYGEERREAFRAASTLSLQFIRTHHATIRDMAARLEAAERDAARYRWIRSKNVGDGRLYEVIHDDYQPAYKGLKFEEGLDAAIDAAMQENGR